LEEINGDLREGDFGPASKSAIKCRIRSALTQAEAAITTSLHRETLADISLLIDSWDGAISQQLRTLIGTEVAPSRWQS
jgi:hypothetical protein